MGGKLITLWMMVNRSLFPGVAVGACVFAALLSWWRPFDTWIFWKLLVYFGLWLQLSLAGVLTLASWVIWLKRGRPEPWPPEPAGELGLTPPDRP